MSPETQQIVFAECASRWGITLTQVQTEYDANKFGVILLDVVNKSKGTVVPGYLVTAVSRTDFLVIIEE